VDDNVRMSKRIELFFYNGCYHRRRSDWNSGVRMAGLTIKVLL